MAGGQLRFLRCSLDLPATSRGIEHANVIVANPNCVAHTLRYPEMTPVSGRQITSRSFGDQMPVFDTGNPISDPLRVFRNIRLVHPHRVVLDRLNLQAQYELPDNAQTLAQFLQTLQGSSRQTFEAIEVFVRQVFPEVKYVNPVSATNNNVSIELTEARTGSRIPLTNCGTGVEQILALATFVLTTPTPGVILIDEPHSFLHPTAERSLVQFLSEHLEHYYFISTHSSILMNSVEPDAIIPIEAPGRSYGSSPKTDNLSRILFDLGYRNSDLLFHDRIVLVEGESDKEILPVLLLKDGEIAQQELDRTGFPVLDGVGKGSTAIQTSIFRHEKLLAAVGRTDQPRIYLLDGDRRDDEQEVIRGTRSPVSGEPVVVQFLPRPEIESYLLVPQAISKAIREEITLRGEQSDVDESNVQIVLAALLADTADPKLFPKGVTPADSPKDRIKQAKASVVLEKLYDRFRLQYHKKHSGRLIAKHISARNQPALPELTALVKSIFPKS